MSPSIIGLFVILIVILVIFTKKATLSKIQWLPGEEILWEEEGGVYYVSFPYSRGSNYLNCKIILTGHRLLLCQKPLVSKDHVINHILFWKGRTPFEKQTLLGTMKKGVVEMESLVSSLELVEEGEKVLLVASPANGGSAMPDQFRITIQNREGLEAALKLLT